MLQFSLEDLEREREALEAEPGLRGHRLECLGRARRWLDEPDGGAFAEAARALEAHPHPTAGTWGAAGGLWRLAGDEQAARRCHEQALALTGDAAHAALLRWLLGERDVAIPLDWPLSRAVAALARGDAEGAVERLADLLRDEGVPPWQASGGSSLHPWDWLELACEAEHGGPLPHVAMLERAGVLGATSGPAEVPDVPPPMGEWRDGDGRLAFDDLGTAVLEAGGSRVQIERRSGRFVVAVDGEPLPGEHPTWSPAVDAAAAALRERGRPDDAAALARVARLAFVA
jgi:hypothetical protein